MMISYNTVKRWLTEHAGTLRRDELAALDHIISDAYAQVAENERKQAELEQKRAELVQEMLQKAEKMGLPMPDLSALLHVQPPQGGKVVVDRKGRPRETVSGSRRPYMNPFEADGILYANFLRDGRKRPAWWSRAESMNISLEDCRFDALERTWKLHNLTPLYADPVTQHAELMAQEPPRIKRIVRTRS